MTIAAGFVADEGIVLCADSQYSAAEKIYRDKILPRHFGASMACFAISGDESYAKSAIEDCCEAMRRVPHDKQSIWEVRQTIRRAITAMLREYDARNLDRDSRPQFMISISTSTEIRLFSTWESAMPPVEHFKCIGSGGYIGNYVMKAFGPRNRVPLKHTLGLALHVVATARRHDLYCGGGVQIMAAKLMTASGIYGHDLDSSGDHITQFEHHAGNLLGSIHNVDLSDEEFKRRIAVFELEVHNLRRDVKKNGSDYKALMSLIDTMP